MAIDGAHGVRLADEIVAHDAGRARIRRDSVASMRIRVVLPAPFGPRMAKIMPRGTSRSMPSTARRSPKRLTRARAEIAASGDGIPICEAALAGSDPFIARVMAVIRDGEP